MIRTSFSVALVLALSSLVQAQEPIAEELPPAPLPEIAVGAVPTTPEMWFYEQERLRQENPKTGVRKKAEIRAAQRQRRIAALKWYGFSNSRPIANPTPMTGTYSPVWTSGGYMPYQWNGAAGGVVLQADRSTHSRR